MSIQRCVLRILECIAIVYLLIEMNAALDQDGYFQKFTRKADEKYLVNGRWSSEVPRQGLPTRLHEILSNRKQKSGGNNHFELRNELPSWNENEHSGSESKMDDQTDFRPSNIQLSSWQPIFDAKIIAAIGNLFTENIKNESNRERLEEEKLRETMLLENLTKTMNDLSQLEFLKDKSNDALRIVGQVTH